MEVSVLASGSTGNAVCVQAGETRILIDGGISSRAITQGLADIGIDASSINAVLVTHEHYDHIKGLSGYGKRNDVPVYARYDTWRAMPAVAKAVPQHNRRILRDCLEIGACKIEAFDTSHDAADPVGFTVFYKEQKFSLVTDIGFVSSRVKQALTGSDMLLFEANHDVELLQQGAYPAYLKRRILSASGHLSNKDAGYALAEITRNNRYTQIMLAHLSQENNRPSLAERTVQSILASDGFNMDSEISLKVTRPDETVSWKIKRI